MRRLRKLHFALSPENPSLSAHWLGDNLQWVTNAGGCLTWKVPITCLHLNTVNTCYAFSEFLTFLSSSLASFPGDLSPGGPQEDPPWDRRLRGRERGQLDTMDQSPGFGERQSRKKFQLLSWVQSKWFHLREPPLSHLKNRDMTLRLTGGSFIHSTRICWRKRLTDLENKLKVAGERIVMEFGTDRYTSPCLKWTANQGLYSTRSSAACHVAAWRGGGRWGEDGSRYMFGWVPSMFPWNYHNTVNQPRVRAKSLQSCLTLYDPMDYSSPGSPVHGILQARTVEWVAMPSSRGSSRPRDQTHIF